MHHKKQYHRVLSEKKMLNSDINTLKDLHKDYEEKYQELSMKYQAAMKEKMLVKMDRDKLRNETEDLTKTIKGIEKKFDVEKGDDDDEYDMDEENDVVSIAKMKHTTSRYEETAKAKKKKQIGSKIPKEEQENPYLTTTFDPFPSKNVNPVKGTKAHDMPVTALAIHPRKPFIATGSDDTTWKIWAIPSGEMIV